MSSMTSPGLIKASNEALVALAPDINIIRNFAYDMSQDFADYGDTVKVPVIASGTLSAFNTSTNDYENPDGTVSWKTVTLSAQPKSTFEFTGKDVTEAPNAPFWSKCAEAGSTAVGGYISQAFGAIFNDTDITLSASLASVTKGNLAKLRKECKARVADTVLALAPDQYADALALFDSNVIGDSDAIRDGQVKKLYGFKSCVELRDLPEGIKGALIPATAVAVASRAVRVADEDCYSEYGTASDENGFTLTVLKHGTPRTGKGYINMTTLFGFGLVQPDKIVLLK